MSKTFDWSGEEVRQLAHDQGWQADWWHKLAAALKAKHDEQMNVLRDGKTEMNNAYQREHSKRCKLERSYETLGKVANANLAEARAEIAELRAERDKLKKELAALRAPIDDWPAVCHEEWDAVYTVPYSSNPAEPELRRLDFARRIAARVRASEVEPLRQQYREIVEAAGGTADESDHAELRAFVEREILHASYQDRLPVLDGKTASRLYDAADGTMSPDWAIELDSDERATWNRFADRVNEFFGCDVSIEDATNPVVDPDVAAEILERDFPSESKQVEPRPLPVLTGERLSEIVSEAHGNWDDLSPEEQREWDEPTAAINAFFHGTWDGLVGFVPLQGEQESEQAAKPGPKPLTGQALERLNRNAWMGVTAGGDRWENLATLVNARFFPGPLVEPPEPKPLTLKVRRCIKCKWGSYEVNGPCQRCGSPTRTVLVDSRPAGGKEGEQ